MWTQFRSVRKNSFSFDMNESIAGYGGAAPTGVTTSVLALRLKRFTLRKVCEVRVSPFSSVQFRRGRY